VNALWSLTAHGDVRWLFETTQTPSEHWGGLVVAPDGRAFFAHYDGVVYALSPAGDVLWSAPGILGNDWHGRFALAPDGALYVAGRDTVRFGGQALSRIDPETGAELWKENRPVDCGRSSLGVRGDGHLSMTCGRWALDVLPAGTIVQVDSTSFFFSYQMYGQSAYDRQGIGYHPTLGLRAVRPDHQDAWWNRDVFGEEPVVGADGAIYLGQRGTVHRVGPDGTVAWTVTVAASGSVYHTRIALLADGTLWVGSGRFLTHLRAATGERIAEVELADPVSSGLVVAPDGTLLVITGRNRIVAINAGAPLDPDAPWPIWRRDNRRTSSVINR
jgi:hypothetical protein